MKTAKWTHSFEWESQDCTFERVLAATIRRCVSQLIGWTEFGAMYFLSKRVWIDSPLLACALLAVLNLVEWIQPVHPNPPGRCFPRGRRLELWCQPVTAQRPLRIPLDNARPVSCALFRVGSSVSARGYVFESVTPLPQDLRRVWFNCTRRRWPLIKI